MKLSRFRNRFSKSGRQINSLSDKIYKDYHGVNKYEVTRAEIAHSMKIMDRDSFRLNGDSIKLDIDQQMAQLGNLKGMSRLERKAKKLAIIMELERTLKYADEVAAIADKYTGEDMRLKIAVKELTILRESDKYIGMSNSAVKKGAVKDEADFWYRTVRMAIRQLGLPKDQFLDELNISMKETGQPVLSQAELMIVKSETSV